MVNTMQQVGGSIGVALLSAFAAQGTSRYLLAHAHESPHAETVKLAATHGYTFAFAISAVIVVVAAGVCGALIRKHQPPAANVGVATAPLPVGSVATA